ncbi:MAG: exopolysaccharide biosynthesis polyprenyl glycosylphosphotransferase [Ginsengibacter sp.]
MNKRFLLWMQRILITLDFIILFLVFFLTKQTWLGDSLKYEYLPFIYIVWIIIAWQGGIYAEKSIISFELFFRKTLKVCFIWFIFVSLFLLSFYSFSDSPEIHSGSFPIGVARIILLIVISIIALLIKIFIYEKTKTYFKEKGLLKRILIIGYNSTSKKLVSYFEQDDINTEILGFAENEQNVKELSNYPIISNIDSSVEIAKQYQVDEIYSTITPDQNPKLYQLIHQADHECIRFRIVPDFSVFIQGPFYVSYFNDMPILTLRSEPLDDLNNRHIKRGFDITISVLVILFILSWLAPLICLLIIFESPGMPFFSQLRTGKNKKSFPCYKFRSMHVNKESDLKQATKNDNRITKVGRILRRTSLDEFPQFINVLIGNMSIVGPRPHMVKHTDDYSKIVNQYMVRHFSKPGITGWAQIHGYRGEISDLVQIRNRIQYDIWYMENWSLLLDIKIMFLTVFNILKGEEKAY